jgi:hypothetical protein
MMKSAERNILEERREGIDNNQARNVVDEMRALRARVRADPEGWTTHDYVNCGRHMLPAHVSGRD